MIKRNVVLIALAAIGLTVLTARAQPAGGMPGMGHHHHSHVGRWRRTAHSAAAPLADLTADQEAQAHQILEAGRPAMKDLFTQLRQANDDLASLLLGSQDVQTDAVAAKQAVIAQLQQQLAQQETDTVLAIRALLSPDQLAKANAAKDQWEARRAEKPPCTKDAN